MTKRTRRYTGVVAGVLGMAALASAAAFTAVRPGDGAAGAVIPALKATAVRGVEVEKLVDPPDVPPVITRDYATRVVVKLDVVEKKMRLADGVTYDFWTFGGTVPGQFIRVREGDLVELHLRNPASSGMVHSIDLHAVNGPGGGSVVTQTAPGQESVFTFTALHPGLYVYHCATAPVPVHIANGMYGLILVQPKDGMLPVDHEYYVMQGEVYTKGAYGEPGLQPFDFQKALDERPPYVVFNGAVGSLMGDHALQARVGQTVRLFVGNAGPNLTSSFHVIGEVFDNAYLQGSSTPSHDVQTTLIPAGGAVTVEFRAPEPGDYALVDHSIFRAVFKGAMGTLHVTGPADLAVYQGHGSRPLGE